MIDTSLLTAVCGLTDVKLLKMLRGYLDSRYSKKKYFSSDYLFVEGDIPVCLVAHLDTVFPAPPRDIFYDKDNFVMWSPQGLGADDRAGVVAILEIIKRGYRPHIIFTMGEELGGIGATALITDVPELEFKCNYLIELDRKGVDDAVFYSCDNKDFKRYITSFGFKENYGSFSDICILSQQWEIASVNLSVGYENEHDEIEYLNTDALYTTINKVCNILDQKEHFYYSYCSSKHCFICEKEVGVQKILISSYLPICVCQNCFKEYWLQNDSKEKEYFFDGDKDKTFDF